MKQNPVTLPDKEFLFHTFYESRRVAQALHTDTGQSCVKYDRIHSWGMGGRFLKFYSSVIWTEARPTFLPPGKCTYWTKPLSMDSFTGRLNYKPLWTSLNLYGLIQTSWPVWPQCGPSVTSVRTTWNIPRYRVSTRGTSKANCCQPTCNRIFEWFKSSNLTLGGWEMYQMIKWWNNNGMKWWIDGMLKGKVTLQLNKKSMDPDFN